MRPVTCTLILNMVNSLATHRLIVVMLLLLAFCGTPSLALSQASEADSQPIEVSRTERMTDTDCARLDGLFAAATKTVPEIVFVLTKVDPDHNLDSVEVARFLVDPFGEAQGKSKKFWTILVRRRQRGCPAPAAFAVSPELESAVIRRFPNLTLTRNDIGTIQLMLRHSLQDLANDYFSYLERISPHPTESELDAEEWKNSASFYRKRLVLSVGEDAVVAMEKSLRDVTPVQLTAVQEREFMDKCAYAMVSNSPEVREVISKLGPDPAWHDCFCDLLMRFSIASSESLSAQGERAKNTVSGSENSEGRAVPYALPPERLLFQRVLFVCAHRKGSSKRSRLSQAETLRLYNVLRDQLTRVRDSFDWYVKGYGSANSEDLRKRQAHYRETLVQQLGEPLVDNLDKMLNEARSRS